MSLIFLLSAKIQQLAASKGQRTVLYWEHWHTDSIATVLDYASVNERHHQPTMWLQHPHQMGITVFQNSLDNLRVRLAVRGAPTGFSVLMASVGVWRTATPPPGLGQTVVQARPKKQHVCLLQTLPALSLIALMVFFPCVTFDYNLRLIIQKCSDFYSCFLPRHKIRLILCTKVFSFKRQR